MSSTATVIAIAIEMLCGVAGALAVGWWWPRLGLAKITTALIGMVGGFALTFVAAQFPGIGYLVGHVENAADSTMRGVGGLTPAVLIGAGVSGLLGGGILMAVLGLIRSRLNG
ncbi:hypothetical protein G6N74_21390 [Mesorhizobium sp. CGMCC 1.15528]|uniref:Uncharacterized protein n=1 Tax=Mesorhizobium zhangyense TaxID=1776730 RepID=A0A7C9V8T0_9HYPH|nr:hypothetical protein [Mesorhizobium zhangyense]NGN43625.1 hypothetical protein [Mesorhizobium zhangyense]